MYRKSYDSIHDIFTMLVLDCTQSRTKITLFSIEYPYDDNITDLSLLQKINEFLKLGITVRSATFQKSFDSEKVMYGIDIITYDTLDRYIIIRILSIFDIVYIKDTCYSHLKHFQDIFYGKMWLYSIQSFVQSYPQITQNIHQCVNDYIATYNKPLSYIGIGGEMLLYSTLYPFTVSITMTNNSIIYNDGILNIHKHKLSSSIQLVDYNTVSLKDFININDELTSVVLLLNIRKKGLTEQLKKEIALYSFYRIIYIGCSNKTVINDLQYLLNLKYQVEHHYMVSINGTPSDNMFSCIHLCK